MNPRQIRDFAKATGQLAKTDALDAGVIATSPSGAPHAPTAPRRDHAAHECLAAVGRELLEMLVAERHRVALAHPAVGPAWRGISTTSSA